MVRLAVLSVALALPAAALAAESAPCAGVGGQQDMNACIAGKVREADTALNGVYSALDGKLDRNGKRNLVAAERAWIAFRDRECDLRSGYDAEHPDNNGTIAPYLVGQCMLDLTLQRTADLRAQLKCPGGDLSCER